MTVHWFTSGKPLSERVFQLPFLVPFFVFVVVERFTVKQRLHCNASVSQQRHFFLSVSKSTILRYLSPIDKTPPRPTNLHFFNSKDTAIIGKSSPYIAGISEVMRTKPKRALTIRGEGDIMQLSHHILLSSI